MIPNDKFEEKPEAAKEEVGEEKVQFINGYTCSSYQNWSEFAPMMLPDEYMDFAADMDRLCVPIPDEAYCKLKVSGTKISSEALFLWKDKKILIFDDDHEKIIISGWQSYSINEVDTKKFAALLHGGNE